MRELADLQEGPIRKQLLSALDPEATAPEGKPKKKARVVKRVIEQSLAPAPSPRPRSAGAAQAERARARRARKQASKRKR